MPSARERVVLEALTIDMPDPYLGSFVPPRVDEESEEVSVDS